MSDQPEPPGANRLARWTSALVGATSNRFWVTDTVLTVAWSTVGVLHLLIPDASLWEDSGNTYRAPGAIGWVLTAALCLPILWGRRFPTSAFFVSWSALFTLVATDRLVGLLPFVEWILIYGVGAYATRRRSAAVFAYMVVGLVGARLSDYAGFDWSSVIRNILMLTACWMFGRFAAASKRNARTKVELAEQRAIVSAQRAHTAVVEERLRLAQELHDIVAHSMSVISVQASMGSAAFDTQPNQTRRALANIERTSGQTLTELRGLLGVLRQDDGSRSTLTPAPSLRGVRALANSLEAAGITTTVVEDGPPALPAGVDAFGYRIVQEAVTNVLKHAHATKVTIEVHKTASAVSLRVRDDGRGHTFQPSNGGHGIVGMKERVATFGGTLTVGPVSGGGFEVLARLPYAADVTEVPA